MIPDEVKTPNVVILPLYDRVVCRKIEDSEYFDDRSKLIQVITTSNQESQKKIEGIVVAVGEGKPNADGTIRPIRVKAGDRILFSKYGAREVKINGVDEYLIILEDQIDAILMVLDQSEAQKEETKAAAAFAGRKEASESDHYVLAPVKRA